MRHRTATWVRYRDRRCYPVPADQSTEGETMKKLKNHHEQAAHHFERASKHHREAAEHLDNGDHVEASRQSLLAHGHALHGYDHAAQATKHHIDAHEESETE